MALSSYEQDKFWACLIFSAVSSQCEGMEMSYRKYFSFLSEKTAIVKTITVCNIFYVKAIHPYGIECA